MSVTVPCHLQGHWAVVKDVDECLLLSLSRSLSRSLSLSLSLSLQLAYVWEGRSLPMATTYILVIGDAAGRIYRPNEQN